MIEVDDLHKKYEDFIAVDNLSFRVYPGEIFGIVGPNGAGKSTTLKMLIGLVRPTSGNIRINGIDMLKEPVEVKSILGFLPEESTLYENMNVEEYLLFFSELYDIEKNTAKKRINELLGNLSLNSSGKKIGDLSKGMKRKVAIARSLINDPQVLIYDEPGSGLDPITSNFITEYISSLKDAGKTIIFSAHNLYQMESLCDRILVVKDGKQVTVGTPNEIKSHSSKVFYRLEFTLGDRKDPLSDDIYWKNDRYVLVTENIDMINDTTKSVVSNNGTILEMRTIEPSLEDIFLQIMNEK